MRTHGRYVAACHAHEHLSGAEAWVVGVVTVAAMTLIVVIVWIVGRR